MASDMQEKLSKGNKIYKPILFLFVVLSFVFAIAGAAITKWSDDYYSVADVEFDKLDAVLAERDELKQIFKRAQDMFICIIVWSLIAMIAGITSYLANRSPSTMYEVNEKKGSDNAGFEKKEEKKDVEKGGDKIGRAHV